MKHSLPAAVAVAHPDDINEKLERRLGRVHACQRLGIERDHEARVFGQGLNFFQIENLLFSHRLIEGLLRLTGFYWQGRRNAGKIQVKQNDIISRRISRNFHGFKILHLSDLHTDMSGEAMNAILGILPRLDYDLCVLTGDYRGKTFGPFDVVIAQMAGLRAALKGQVLGVLGNHDSVRMIPAFEGMGIRMLLNESIGIERGDQKIHIAGIDDAHFYRVDNIEKAAETAPHEEFSILLSHTPEIYRQAAHAGFDLLLSGHTHGGQICLPGGIAITHDAVLPRSFGVGAWKHGDMAGYTSAGAGSSVVPVRFNCPPEITLHYLHSNLPQRSLIRAVPYVERE
jgi:predicted MPP superfamily phosphohydrolase